MPANNVTRRTFLRLAAASATGALISACGGPSGTTPAADAPPAADTAPEAPAADTAATAPAALGAPAGDVSWYLGGDDPFYTEIATAFQEENPDANVQVLATPWAEWQTKLFALAAADQMPDVIWFVSGQPGVRLDLGLWAQRDALMDLSMLQSEVKEEDFIDPSLLAPAVIDGKLMGLPYEFNNILFYYDKDRFDQAGVAYPDDTWTWDKVAEVGKQLAAPDQNTFGVVHPQFMTDHYMGQAGTQMFTPDGLSSNFDKPAAKTAYEYIHRLIDEDKIMPAPGAETGVGLDAGTVAMEYNGSWQFDTYRQTGRKFGATIMPAGPASDDMKHYTVQRENMWAVAAKPQSADVALAFTKYLGLGGGLERWAATGRLAPYKRFTVDDYLKATGAAGTDYEDTFRQVMDAVFAGSAYAQQAPMLPAEADGNDYGQIIDNERLAYLVDGSQDVETTLANTKQQVDEYLESKRAAS